jgi:uncharacterized protein
MYEFSFEWDAGNVAKSFQKHGVTGKRRRFFMERRFVPLGEQYHRPSPEPRFGGLGETSRGKLLFLAFAARKQSIRVISVRAMNERERKFYASLRQE